jgi:hypothetical protein
MQLRFLHVSGPKTEPANVDFAAGLNVIYGPSNTGKSHILRLIDYVLGAKSPPESIAEQGLYDLVHLGVAMDDGTEKTLIRALGGGEIRIIEGLSKERPAPKQGISVSAQHGAKVSLSKILLDQLGAAGSVVQTNAAGKTRELSFRDLDDYALVDEEKIQARTSPVLTGQYMLKPVETAVFKYVLTGVDDSALNIAKPETSQPMRQAAQLELLDQQIREIEHEITAADHNQEELEKLDSSLDAELAKSFHVQEETESDYRRLTGRRRELRREHEDAQDRIAEIDTLLARFQLLQQHYGSDHERLTAVIEAGTLFALEGGEVCPICGADPAQHRPASACDGNIDEIIEAARAEISDLERRSTDLEETMHGLTEERTELADRAREILPQLATLTAGIQQEVPSVQNVRSETNRVFARKLVVQKSLDLIRRRERLQAQRADLGIVPGYDSSTIVAEQSLNGAVLDSLCKVIEAELETWQFPNGERVFFELPKMDISVSGKPRAANGKGVRALLHGAFSVGLMKYCRERKRAHPGFLVLDSLFVTYKDPDGLEDVAIKNTPLKDRAFSAFADLTNDYQLVVLDNVDVPDWLAKEPNCIHFTGQPSQGRAGFFPSLPVGQPI